MKHLKNRLEELKEEVKITEEKLSERGLKERKKEDIEWIYTLLGELEEYIEEENIDSAFSNIEDIEYELDLLGWNL